MKKQFLAVSILSFTAFAHAGTMGEIDDMQWTGFYAGLNAGGVWGGTQFRWFGISESISAFSAGAATVLPAAADATLSTSGFTGGAQIGANYQVENWFAGLEGDFNYAGLSTLRSAISLGDTNGGPVTITPGSIYEKFTTQWLSTVRGRFGYVSNDWLFYGTGGLAIANAILKDQVCFPEAGISFCNRASVNKTGTGWTAGAGIEWQFMQKWSAKVEYLYVDIGRISSTSLDTTTAGFVPFPNAAITHRHHFTENVVRAGINYLFC